MDASKPKLSTDDEDYWKHTDLGKAWDDGCRIRHKQPSWYFSFIGRKSKMAEWRQTIHNNKRGRGRNGRFNNRGSDGVASGHANNGGVDDLASGVARVQIEE